MTDDGETNPADRGPYNWSRIEISAFDEQVRQPGTISKLSDLPPEPSPLKREVEIRDRLPLD